VQSRVKEILALVVRPEMVVASSTQILNCSSNLNGKPGRLLHGGHRVFQKKKDGHNKHEISKRREGNQR
jgi:hypothetical protein